MPIYWHTFRTRGVYADIKVFRRTIQNGMRKEVAPALIGKHKEHVVDWKDPPGFRYRTDVSAKRTSITIYPIGRGRLIWHWLSKGVPARPIYPKKKKFLKIRTGYAPKTAPGAFGGPGKAFGPTLVRKYAKKWPGIAPRRFEEYIADWYRPLYKPRMENILRRATRAAQKAGK